MGRLCWHRYAMREHEWCSRALNEGCRFAQPPRYRLRWLRHQRHGRFPHARDGPIIRTTDLEGHAGCRHTHSGACMKLGAARKGL